MDLERGWVMRAVFGNGKRSVQDRCLWRKKHDVAYDHELALR